MFAKTITGKGFGGTIDYAFYGKREDVQRDERGKKIARGEVIGGTVSGTTRRELMNDFQAVKDLKPDKVKPMAHHILAFSPEDEAHLTDGRMNEIAGSYMEKKGYSEKAVYVVIKHEDTDNRHLHIIAATTETDGRGIFLARTKDRDLSQQLERENNLREVERPESQSKNEKPAKFNELQMIERTGEPSAKIKLQESIKTALKESKTTTEFLAYLKLNDTNARFNLQNTGRIAGISFETDGVAFKGSSLGKDYSWTGLQKQGLSYEPERDLSAIEAANAKTPHTEKPEVEKIPTKSPSVENHPMDAAEAKARHTAQLINIAYAGRIGEKTLEVIEARLSRGDKGAPQIAFKDNAFDWHTTQSRAEDFVNMSAYIASEEKPIAIWRSNLRDNCAASYLVEKLTSAALEIENRSLPPDFQKTLKNAFVESANQAPSEGQLDSVKKAAAKLGCDAPNLPTKLEAMTYLVMNKTPAELNKLSKGFEQHFKENPPRQTEQDRPRRTLRMR